MAKNLIQRLRNTGFALASAGLIALAGNTAQAQVQYAPQPHDSTGAAIAEGTGVGLELFGNQMLGRNIGGPIGRVAGFGTSVIGKSIQQHARNEAIRASGTNVYISPGNPALSDPPETYAPIPPQRVYVPFPVETRPSNALPEYNVKDLKTRMENCSLTVFTYNLENHRGATRNFQKGQTVRGAINFRSEELFGPKEQNVRVSITNESGKEFLRGNIMSPERKSFWLPFSNKGKKYYEFALPNLESGLYTIRTIASSGAYNSEEHFRVD